MSIDTILAYAAAVAYVVLAMALLVHRPASLPRWLFVAGLAGFALEAFFIGMSMGAASAEDLLRWQQWSLAPKAVVPSVWLLFSVCYARGNYREFVRRWMPGVTVLVAVPLVLVAGLGPRVVEALRFEGQGRWVMLYGWGGKGVNVIVLFVAVLVMMNLERTFRTAMGVMRWRIKYLVLGLVLVFGVKVYTSSQGLLYSGAGSNLQFIYVCALVLAVPMIGLALLRTRLGDADVYPSQAVLHHSLTAMLVAVYLLITGVLAKIVSAYGGDAWFPLKSLLILVALMGLSILLFSDRLRHRTALWVSRHFQRPLYDYRKVWSAFTERTTSFTDDTSLSRAVVTLIAETFHVLSVSVWLVDEQQHQLEMVASTLLTPETTKPLDLKDPAFAALAADLTRKPHPVDLDRLERQRAELLTPCDPDFFKKGGNRVCVPLVSHGEFLGLLTIADRVSGFRFSLEDFALLKCIGDQVGASLRNLRMTGRLLQAKQMEAFQNMATFFVHDLKNTASTLSLITQNMTAHFQDPSFREDAMRGLTRSVQHLNELIGRLTALRQNLDTTRVPTDLNALVTQALSPLEGTPGLTLSKDLQPLPKILADPDQLHKVITNLAMNAREALCEHGEIRVATSQSNGWIELTVADNGCGMSRDFIQHRLFKPFATTKKQGLGIGMLHCKTIVEAHQGRIEVESQQDKGTRFRVLLPIESR